MSVNHDLRSLKFLWNLEIEGLSNIASAVVDYRGHRVLCQSIIPGILNQTPEHTAKYGSIDEGQTINTDPEFHQLMEQVCSKLALSDSYLLDQEGAEKHIWGALDTKGIKGSDQRLYFLEAARLTPRDTNFVGDQYSYCLVRPELVDLYIKKQHNAELERRSQQLLEEKRKQDPEANKLTTEELQGLIRELPSLSFNPNAFTSARFSRDREAAEAEVQKLGQFLVDVQVPLLVRSLCKEDGNWTRLAKDLPEYLHKFGINCRYLGLIASQVTEAAHIRAMLERHAVARAVKHVFGQFLRDTSDYLLAETTAQLLNCLLVRGHSSSPSKGKRKRNRTKNQATELLVLPQSVKTTHDELWAAIKTYAESFYGLNLALPWQGIAVHDLQVVFLREVCLQVGIKLYPGFTLGQFKAADVAGFHPRVKTLDWRSMESRWLQDLAMRALAENNLDNAVEMLTQSAGIQAQVTGPLHVDVATCYQRISQCYLAKGKFAQALNFQHKAILILEKVLGFDHLLVGHAYSTFGYQYQALGKFKRGMKHLIHAFQIFLVNNGLLSSDTIAVLINICVAYRELGQHQSAIEILNKVHVMCEQLYGPNNLNVAECAQLLANEFKALHDYPMAKEWEAKALAVYRAALPAEDPRVSSCQKNLEAIECLRSGKLPASSPSKAKPTDQKSYLKQKLYARKLKAKLNLPAHQLHLANQYFDVPASSLTRQQIEQQRVQALAEQLNSETK